METNFNQLSELAFAEGSGITEKNNLWVATFKLTQWHFIARGEFPNQTPYVARNENVAEGQYFIKAFTDTDKLHNFAKENNLLDANGTTIILSVPVSGIIPWLQGFSSQGVHGIHFNADTESYGFYAPLVQLSPIYMHLQKKGLL